MVRTRWDQEKEMTTIAASNGVRKVEPREGRTIQIGNARLTWKVTGEDIGYSTNLYTRELIETRLTPAQQALSDLWD